jgi:hypothetical protein
MILALVFSVLSIGILSMFPKYSSYFFIMVTHVGFISITVLLFQLGSSVQDQASTVASKKKAMLQARAVLLYVMAAVFGLLTLGSLGIWRYKKMFPKAFSIIDASADMIIKDTKRLLFVPVL